MGKRLDIKQIIKQGETSLLLPDDKEKGGGLSWEVYLLQYKGKRYVMRRCPSLKHAKQHEKLSNRLEKHGFLPKLLGRSGKVLLYHYIEGRDLKNNEKAEAFKKLGMIAAHVNTIKSRGNPDRYFLGLLNELVKGKVTQTVKSKRRVALDIQSGIRRKLKEKALFTKEQGNEIKKIYFYLRDFAKPKIVLDIVGINPGNFRLSKEGKIYFVDVDAVKSDFKGFGINRCFKYFSKSVKKQESLRKGYESVSSMQFLNKEYRDLCNLSSLIRTINVACQTGKDYKKDIRTLLKLVDKYKNKINFSTPK